MNTSHVIIAIDGTSASGKGTIARRLAEHFDFAYLDTGLLYRAVALTVLNNGHDPNDEVAAEKVALALDPTTINEMASNPALRADAVSIAASKVAAIQAVRSALFRFQREFAENPPGKKMGAILDGRDIGIVIAPEAPVKFYITADLTVRAARRVKELHERGEFIEESLVLAEMKARDERDLKRTVVPAKPAEDAVILDTTHMTIDQAFSEALHIAQSKLGYCVLPKMPIFKTSKVKNSASKLG